MHRDPIPDIQPHHPARTNGPGAATSWQVWPAADGFSTLRQCAIRHNLHEHPLLQLPALAALAAALIPHKLTRYLRPGTTQTSEFSHDSTHPDGLTVDQVFANIEEPGSWVALYQVETIPEYRAMLEQVMASAAPLYEAEQHGIFNIHGFIFISAPPSVTPFHIDRENNFWLQIRGRKLMTVWDRNDRDVVTQEHVERFISFRELDNVRLKEEHRSRGTDHDVGPGDGVYFPSTSPHMTRTDSSWVKPGDGVSISIGVNFYSRETQQTARIHCLNEFLRRRIGLRPKFPGRSALTDSLKQPMCDWLLAQRRRKGIPSVPGLD
jgi:hypothetical protein